MLPDEVHSSGRTIEKRRESELGAESLLQREASGKRGGRPDWARLQLGVGDAHRVVLIALFPHPARHVIMARNLRSPLTRRRKLMARNLLTMTGARVPGSRAISDVGIFRGRRLGHAEPRRTIHQPTSHGTRFEAREPRKRASVSAGSARALVPYAASGFPRHQIDLDGFQGDVLCLGYKEEGRQEKHSVQ